VFLQRVDVGRRGKLYDERSSVGKREWTEIKWIDNKVNS
jgi:hypothetical protein